MLIQSLINVQIESLKETLGHKVFPIDKLTNPREMSCIGFNITNPQLEIKNSFLLAKAGYVVAESDEEFCLDFELKFKEGPLQGMKSVGKEFPSLNRLITSFDKKKEKEAAAGGKIGNDEL